ncbi:conserved protein of unknown function [Ectopseudomonas oleovorans]|uniref:Uncharacterized protein n=1 Tax=Ectopseudomonas oleovorans TaxID=301 RepID=A0A653BCJ1_ECTOL|nr:conserved protein of unknown function [Pseudomonas oleovorans]
MQRQSRCRHQPGALAVHRQGAQLVLGDVRGRQTGDDHHIRPASAQLPGDLDGLLQAGRLAAGQQLELELVGGDDSGAGNGLIPQKVGNRRIDEHTTPDIAHHRVAQVAQRRVVLANITHRLENHPPAIGIPQITGKHGRQTRQHATFTQPQQHVADMFGTEYLAAKLAITGVVGELHGMDRQHFEAQTLQGEDCSGVTDMAPGHMRLDRQNEGRQGGAHGHSDNGSTTMEWPRLFAKSRARTTTDALALFFGSLRLAMASDPAAVKQEATDCRIEARPRRLTRRT